MLPNINPNDLIIFYVVAREKSLTSAADKIFLTQPAVTYHIQSLEKYTNVKLLDFRKHQVVLTPLVKSSTNTRKKSTGSWLALTCLFNP